MGPDDGGVQDEPLHVRVLEDLEHPSPDALLGPAVEPPPGAVPVAEVLGQVAPRGTRLGDPKDGIDEQAIVLGDLPMLTGLAGKEVLDSLPVGIFDRVAGWHCRPSVVGKQARVLPELPSYCPHDLAVIFDDLADRPAEG